jgi:hypothetical protein
MRILNFNFNSQTILKVEQFLQHPDGCTPYVIAMSATNMDPYRPVQ